MLLFTHKTKRQTKVATTLLHRRRNIRRRLSVAPASIPAASALQQSFGLRENLGSGKLLGGGARLNTVPENISNSSMATTFPKLLSTAAVDENTRETSLGRSFGSGPNRLVEATIKDSETARLVDGAKSCLFGSSLFVGFDFFGVRDWSLRLLFGFRVREGREYWWAMGVGRGRRGGCW